MHTGGAVGEIKAKTDTYVKHHRVFVRIGGMINLPQGYEELSINSRAVGSIYQSSY